MGFEVYLCDMWYLLHAVCYVLFCATVQLPKSKNNHKKASVVSSLCKISFIKDTGNVSRYKRMPSPHDPGAMWCRGAVGECWGVLWSVGVMRWGVMVGHSHHPAPLHHLLLLPVQSCGGSRGQITITNIEQFAHCQVEIIRSTFWWINQTIQVKINQIIQVTWVCGCGRSLSLLELVIQPCFLMA